MDDIRAAARAATALFRSLHLPGLVIVAAILIATWLVVSIVAGTLRQLGNRITRWRFGLNRLATLLRFTLSLAGFALALSVHVSEEALIGVVGTAAVAIGLAAKDVLASVLAGIVILIDRPFQVGDRVTFGGVYGEVTSIGLRSVRLTTLDDSIVTIPNSVFLVQMVTSGNLGALHMLVQMDFHVGVDQDVALAKRLVLEALGNNEYVHTDRSAIILVSQLLQEQMTTVRLRAKAYVVDVRKEKAFESLVTERVLAAFLEHRILPPAVLRRSLSPGDPIASRDRAA